MISQGYKNFFCIVIFVLIIIFVLWLHFKSNLQEEQQKQQLCSLSFEYINDERKACLENCVAAGGSDCRNQCYGCTQHLCYTYCMNRGGLSPKNCRSQCYVSPYAGCVKNCQSTSDTAKCVKDNCLVPPLQIS